ncbi:hypothetical protein DFH06DRAFT_1372108 [Mycena polygramma]|nr:hypothetical protein DFH06DRAFT_1372108 [Mycena polygramma]
MASVDNMESSLPHDLERKIFELAAVLDYQCIPRLMCVAWRVKAWVEPLLYQATYVDIPQCIYPGRSPNDFDADLIVRPDFFRDAIRHLSIHYTPLDLFEDSPGAVSPSTAQIILATCTRIETLALHGPSDELLSSIEPLDSLTRLHADLGALFCRFPRGQRGTVFDALNFSRITHLEMRDQAPSEEICSGLNRLPCLTHLALMYNARSRGIESLCTRVLQTCAPLRVLAALMEKRRTIGASRSDSNYCAVDTPRMIDNDDLRFVLVTFPRKRENSGEWLREVRSGRLLGFWECAEEAVERRMAAHASTR